MTPEQSRVALGFTVRRSAALARVGASTIYRFEASSELRPQTVEAIRGTLGLAGVGFISEYGNGVRVRSGERNGGG